MPRTFEVLTDQEDVHPVVVDYTPMMPINLRTACSGFLADLFWLEVMPVTYVRFTVLPAVPKGLTPEQAAAHCQAEIARHAEVPRQELDVNCFDKRHWRKTVEARLHPRCRISHSISRCFTCHTHAFSCVCAYMRAGVII